MLKINLLGKTRIMYREENLESKLSNKVIAMIYLLIANKGKYLSKEKLMLYLWPESAEDAARYNLRYNLWLLKKALPETEDGQSLVLSDKDGCALNEAYPMECDLLTIKELNLQSAGIDELIYAKNLFRGSIMEGWYLKNCSEFNEFILFDRMTCENRQTEILSALAGKFEEAGEFGKALEVLREQAAIEPENEDIALKIMKMYAALGNRTAAISYYKTFEAALWNSLKITPEAKVSKYYKSLQCGSIKGTGSKPHEASQEKTVVSHENTTGARLAVSGYCIGNVDYFLMGDLLYGLIKKVDYELLAQMEYEAAVDLGYICRAFLSDYEEAVFRKKGQKQNLVDMKIPESVPAVRIILEFRKFIETVSASCMLELNLKNYQEVDRFSAAAIDYLQNSEIENLKINICK